MPTGSDWLRIHQAVCLLKMMRQAIRLKERMMKLVIGFMPIVKRVLSHGLWPLEIVIFVIICQIFKSITFMTPQPPRC